MVATVTISGLDVTLKNMDRLTFGLNGNGLARPMKEATAIVTSDAKKLSPVDTGNLRASIAPEIRPFGYSIEGVVGTDVKYGPAMELGTPPHLVPLADLEVWARRHKTSAKTVQNAIATKGTKPRLYLQGAFEKNTDKINQIFDDYVNGLVK